MTNYPYSPESDGSVPAHTHAESDVIGLAADLAARAKYRGAWSGTSANYAVGDLVLFRGALWICTTANTSGTFTNANFAALSSKIRERVSPQRIGGWYQGSLVNATRTLAPNLNRLYLQPCYTDEPITIGQLSVNVSTFVASSLVRAGVYLPGNSDSRSQLNPTSWSLLTEAGTIDTSASTGVKLLSGLSIAIPGESWFFVAGVTQGAAASLTVGGNDGSSSPLGTQGSGYGTTANLAYYLDGVTGALPATVSGVSMAANDAGVAYYRSA